MWVWVWVRVRVYVCDSLCALISVVGCAYHVFTLCNWIYRHVYTVHVYTVQLD